MWICALSSSTDVVLESESGSAGKRICPSLRPRDVGLCLDVHLSEDRLGLGRLDIAITKNNIMVAKTWDGDGSGHKMGPVDEQDV